MFTTSSNETLGTGPLYQGRFKAFPIEKDDHYFSVCRYVERNAARANLVARAEDWRWSRLGREADAELRAKLSAGPVPFPPNWLPVVNRPQSEKELALLRRSVVRSPLEGDVVRLDQPEYHVRQLAKLLGILAWIVSGTDNA